MNKINLVLLAIMSLFLVGCGSQTMTGDSYSGNQARKAQTLKMGQIESVKSVEIKSQSGGVGALAGGAIGGIAASNIGGGKMSLVSAIVGAVAGGARGHVVVGSGCDPRIDVDHRERQPSSLVPWRS